MMIRTTVRTREGRSFHESGTDPLDPSTRDRGPRVHQGRRARIGPRIRPIRARTASDATLAALADNSQRALRVGFPGIGGIQFVATRDRIAETSADCSPVTLGRGASREGRCRTLCTTFSSFSCFSASPRFSLPEFPPFHFSFVLFVGRAVCLRPQTRLNWSDPRYARIARLSRL